MTLDDFIKPGTISFLEIGHDDDCPGRYTNGDGCCCSPTFAMHNSVDRFLRGEAKNRAARRKAAREAEKALRKARKAKS